jgi:hypothetical protein
MCQIHQCNISTFLAPNMDSLNAGELSGINLGGLKGGPLEGEQKKSDWVRGV